MQFMAYCLDKPGALEIRMANRPKHVEYLTSYNDKLLFAGPLLDGEAMIGSLLVLDVADVELPFVTHNEELVRMLASQIEHQLEAREQKQSTVGSVKWVLRRLLSGSRPDVGVVAKELGMSERTLQRRITEEGMTFRQLLNDTRKELIREYLSDESVEITEAAFLVGFENTNSFYRAFRSWEGKTPAEWRTANRGRN